MTDLQDFDIYAMPIGGLPKRITSDVLNRIPFKARWGINGETPLDILADPGEARFTLRNDDGKYYPGASTAYVDWKQNLPIVVVCTYGDMSYVRFRGYLDIDSIRVGKVSNLSTVSVTLLDWMIYAVRTPIAEPDVAVDQTADDVLTTLMTYMPIQPQATSFEAGDYTFPVVFDSIGMRTKGYQEMAKAAYSEGGHCYLTKTPYNGEQLVLENATHRDSSHQLNTYYLYTPYYWQNHVGAPPNARFKTHSGGEFKNHTSALGYNIGIYVSSYLDKVEIDHGKNVINRAAVTAYPKRVDTDPQILYSLDYPMFIADGATIEFRAHYTDQETGREISALQSSMLTPVAPGATWSELKLLTHFIASAGTYVDATGNHTITKNSCTSLNEQYLDVGTGRYRGTGCVLGYYGLFGGYSPYNCTVPDSADWDFGSGAFTIGFYLMLFNPADGNNVIARDTATYTPWLIGCPDGSGNMELFMSSNGSSWDMANGRSMGKANVERWTHYEVCRDADKWFRTFVDGVMIDKWYSASAFPANANALTIGKTETSNYGYFGMDELYIIKGQCLHADDNDFTPPTEDMSATLDGDYGMNTAEDGTGTDKSSDLTIAATYGSEAVTYTLTNGAGEDCYITKLQARGLGIYPYNPIEYVAEDATSQTSYGYKEVSIQQHYQQDLAAGTTWTTDIIADEKDPRTRLKSISFYANKNETTMLWFLNADVGYLIRVAVTDPEINGYYYIQGVEFEVRAGGIIYVTWRLKDGETPV